MIDARFWRGKRVFLTGHTGFKGSWLTMCLHSLGADITGYALRPPTDPSLFESCRIGSLTHKSIEGDVRDGESLKKAMTEAAPDIVIHMAAQPLVRHAYKYPVETYSINVMGTVNVFEAVRGNASVKAVINVTSDKCYQNKEWVWGYREDEALGGYDPYSSSKACSELVTGAYRDSFFNPGDYDRHGVGVASARAGNVIGGGDWAEDRLIPDCMRALINNERIVIRNPAAIRPWQHVLEPVCGYLLLAQKLISEGRSYAQAWNFGPEDHDARSVEWIVNRICELWGAPPAYIVDDSLKPHEAGLLKLDCSKAKARLNWSPRWSLETAMNQIVNWVKAYQSGQNMLEVSLRQIDRYMSDEAAGRQGGVSV